MIIFSPTTLCRLISKYIQPQSNLTYQKVFKESIQMKTQHINGFQLLHEPCYLSIKKLGVYRLSLIDHAYIG